MLPLKLIIEGLYSYQQRQTIDFSQLTSAGVFGIFGAVGSGKSSILEAITFALYGETERLNQRDKRTYNMMNLKSKLSYICFEFQNFEEKKFRIIRESKRSSKRFEEVSKTTATFYEWKNNDWLPLDHTNAEKIIGLSYTNFKRTIIIPQGQFKEFIELGAKDRTTMMKEIFSLEKFDLAEKAKLLNERNNTILHHLEGQLKSFEQVTEEQINENKTHLATEKKAFKEISLAFEKITEEYQLLKLLKTDWEALTDKKKKFNTLAQREAEFIQKAQQADQFEAVYKAFYTLLSDERRLKTELQSAQEKRDHQKIELSQTQVNEQKLKNELSSLLPLYENLSKTKEEEQDLANILQILHLSHSFDILNQRIQKGNKEIEKTEQILEEKKREIEALDKKISEQKALKIDHQLISNLSQWFDKKINLTERKQKQKDRIKEIQNQLDRIDEEMKNIPLFSEGDGGDFKAKLSIEIERLEKQKAELSKKRGQLEVQRELSRFTTALHLGESCPLCGSKEHPNITHFEDVSEALSGVEKEWESIERQLKTLLSQEKDWENSLGKRQSLEEQFQKEDTELKEIDLQISAHHRLFIWEGFSADDFEGFQQKKQQSFEVEKQIEKLESQKLEIQKSQEQETENLGKYRKGLEKITSEASEKKGEILSLEKSLKQLSFDSFENENPSDVEQKLKQIAQQNKGVEEKYQILTEQLSTLSIQLAEQSTRLNDLENRLSELNKSLTTHTDLFRKTMQEHKMQSQQEVEKILAQNINIVEIRKEVADFWVDFKTLKNAIEELELKFKGVAFNEEQFISTQAQFLEKQKEKDIKQSILTKIEAEIERLEKLFAEKKNLIAKYDKIQKRAENLSIMLKLFKGAGFVEYVSSIFLRQLCHHANTRFHRMTRGQLSIQLNENNDFEIIDYLNEGRSRSVKTLSGGQAFQCSLSLALALAESVQTEAKAEKNFFFIDEGFGTQDSESINIIFETLMNLQKENRIVGIISHIEELKERIPLSLSVTKDEEKGSLIKII